MKTAHSTKANTGAFVPTPTGSTTPKKMYHFTQQATVLQTASLTTASPSVKTPNHRPKANSTAMRIAVGFSLIELLAAIAVVAILTTILIPTTAHIRSSAQRSQCGSNLRQAATLMLLYAGDNNGEFPAVFNPIEGLGNNNTYARTLVEGGYVSQRSNIFGCPSDSKNGTLTNSNYTLRTYALTVPGMQGTLDQNRNFARRSLQSVPDPTRTGMLTEWDQRTSDLNMFTVEGPWGSAMGDDQINEANAYTSSPHGANGRHVAFMDAHVEFMEHKQMRERRQALFGRTLHTP